MIDVDTDDFFTSRDLVVDPRISEEHHGSPEARRYRYHPTFILRGLTELHLDLTEA